MHGVFVIKYDYLVKTPVVAYMIEMAVAVYYRDLSVVQFFGDFLYISYAKSRIKQDSPVAAANKEAGHILPMFFFPDGIYLTREFETGEPVLMIFKLYRNCASHHAFSCCLNTILPVSASMLSMMARD